MFKQKLEVLARDFPQLREEIDLELFAKVTASGVKISGFNSVIFIDETGLAGKTRYYQTQDKNTLNMLALISRKMRLLLGRYPKLKEELGNQLYEFVTTHVFDDAISMEEMERLVEVVKYPTVGCEGRKRLPSKQRKERQSYFPPQDYDQGIAGRAFEVEGPKRSGSRYR
jgi:hypothetical protein